MKVLADLDTASLQLLFNRFDLEFIEVPPDQEIPGSFWGAPEAGIIRSQVFARADTPIHSILHESCHSICMTPERRAVLHTDAGGDFDEENAVCYLQIVLADDIPGYSSTACQKDMDDYGYTFRLGSAGAWFERDAEDARAWLVNRKLLQ